MVIFRCFLETSFGSAFGAHVGDFDSLSGSLLDTILVTFWVHVFFDFGLPKTSKKEGVLGKRPGAPVHAPPSSDFSPLVNPLRVLPVMHRTHWTSQSFPEQQTSVLSQQKTSVQSPQMTSNPGLRRPRQRPIKSMTANPWLAEVAIAADQKVYLVPWMTQV